MQAAANDELKPHRNPAQVGGREHFPKVGPMAFVSRTDEKRKLAGQRAQFTWGLNEYNKTDDPDERARFARHMAKYIRDAPANNFTVEQITQGRSYPAEEVQKYVKEPDAGSETAVSDAQALQIIETAVDTTIVRRKGSGTRSVYVYGYKCAPDRLKIGYTDGDTVQRIAQQISTSTPDKPVLFLEIRTDNCRVLERALHSIFAYRGRKVVGAGDEWFLASVDEIEHLCDFIEDPKTWSSKPDEQRPPALSDDGREMVHDAPITTFQSIE